MGGSVLLLFTSKTQNVLCICNTESASLLIIIISSKEMKEGEDLCLLIIIISSKEMKEGEYFVLRICGFFFLPIWLIICWNWNSLHTSVMGNYYYHSFGCKLKQRSVKCMDANCQICSCCWDDKSEQAQNSIFKVVFCTNSQGNF